MKNTIKLLSAILIMIVFSSCMGMKLPVGKYYHRQFQNRIMQRHLQDRHVSGFEANWSLRPKGDPLRFIMKNY